MGKVWVAVVCVILMVSFAAGAVFFATAGTSLLANGLADLARRSGPELADVLYRASLRVNPYDAAHRLELCDLYRRQGRDADGLALLRTGVEEGYAVGPDLYVALAAQYVDSGDLDAACNLLERPMSDYLARRIWVLRPKNAAAPPSGAYAEGMAFPLSAGEGTPWYRLDGGPWTLYGEPLRLTEGKHKLEVVTLNGGSLPSPVDEYTYTVEQLENAFEPVEWVTCPYCGGVWAG